MLAEGRRLVANIEASRTAAMLAVFAMGLWVLVLVALTLWRRRPLR
jgi:hypothetical protein